MELNGEDDGVELEVLKEVATDRQWISAADDEATKLTGETKEKVVIRSDTCEDWQ